MKTKTNAIIALMLVTFALSCEKDYKPVNISVEELQGYVQKGPYINGTSVSISELTENLAQTGKMFSSQIVDNKGTFALRSLQLNSQFVELQSNGFYFNEITGETSSAQLTLYALSDISTRSRLNINVLSHLEKPRVEYLVNNGRSFGEAKKQAQREILEIFEISNNDVKFSEDLDISTSGDDNAALLAISVILQGYRSVTELSELLANIITDYREDGTIESEIIGSALINHASVLNVADIRANMAARYAEMGVEADIPDFEKYIQQFIENTPFEITGLINFPQFSEYGENILFEETNNLIPDKFYSLAADIPLGGSLKIIMNGGIWFYNVSPFAPVNWKISFYDFSRNEQIFTSVESGKSCDLKIQFPAEQLQDSIMVFYYFNGAELPDKTKILYVEDYFIPNDTAKLEN